MDIAKRLSNGGTMQRESLAGVVRDIDRTIGKTTNILGLGNGYTPALDNRRNLGCQNTRCLQVPLISS
jgi:hypothetical protein